MRGVEVLGVVLQERGVSRERKRYFKEMEERGFFFFPPSRTTLGAFAHLIPARFLYFDPVDIFFFSLLFFAANFVADKRRSLE